MKSQVAVNAIIYIGMIAISGLMFAQVPGMVNDIKTVTSQESVIEQAKTIASLLSLASATPNEIKIFYELPDQYSISVKDGYVTVITDNEQGISKTLSDIEFEQTNVKSLVIMKDRMEAT